MATKSTSEAKITSQVETPSSRTLTRSKVVEEASKWIDIPFRHQGRNALGVDCCGVVIKTGQNLGLTTYDTTNYHRRTSGEQFIHHFRDAGLIEVSKRDLKPGMVLVTTDDNFPCHCGIVVMKRGQLHMLHAYLSRRKVVVEPLEHWKSKIIAAFDYPGVVD